LLGAPGPFRLKANADANPNAGFGSNLSGNNFNQYNYGA